MHKYDFTLELPPMKELCDDEFRQRLKKLAANAPKDEHVELYQTRKEEADKGHEKYNMTKKIKSQIANLSVEEFLKNLDHGDCLTPFENGCYTYYNIYHDMDIVYWSCKLILMFDKAPKDIGLTPEDDWLIYIPRYIERNYDLIGADEDEVDKLEKAFRMEDIRREGISKSQKKPITIRLKCINTTIPFGSREECRKYLNLSEKAWGNFLKGKSRMNQIYEIVDWNQL